MNSCVLVCEEVHCDTVLMHCNFMLVNFIYFTVLIF